MPIVVLHKNGQAYEGEVKENTNLVVRAGIKQFPFPNLRYECGMGKCAKCASRILSGGEHLPPPNWKEKKQLGDRLALGYRLMCQLWINHDLELEQDEVPLPPAEALALPAKASLSTPTLSSATTPAALTEARLSPVEETKPCM